MAIIPQFWPPHGLFLMFVSTDETIVPPSSSASPFRSSACHVSVKPAVASPARRQPS
jgi:hypothetical protein